MRVFVDEDACVGTGQCELLCPDVFQVDVVSQVLIPRPAPELHDAVREAVEACPTEAIHVEE